MTTIAISGINAVDNPGSGIGIARSLKESGQGYTCIGLSYDAMDPGLYMDKYIDKGFLLPYPSASEYQYIARIVEICEQNEVDVIIPAFDTEIPHYIRNKAVFEEKGIGILVPTREQYEATTKEKLSTLAALIGLRTPATIAVTSLEELTGAANTLGFPLMVKGRFYEAYKAYSYQEAQGHFQKLAQTWGFPILVQQYIEGDDYNVIGLGSREGRCLGAVAIKKLLLTKQGKIWTAVTIDNSEMIARATNFVKATGFTGGFELELRRTKHGELYLIEINPRFPAWVYFASAVGINLPLRYVQYLLDRRSEFPLDYQAGKLLVRYTGEMIRDIADLESITVKGEKV